MKTMRNRRTAADQRRQDQSAADMLIASPIAPVSDSEKLQE